MFKYVHKPKYNTRVANVTTDAAILNKRDYRRIKKEAVHYTPQERIEMAKEIDDKRKTHKQTIKSKRVDLIRAENMKQERIKYLENQREMEERDYALKVAEAKANEELDEVKMMNHDMMEARVKTIRDAQIELNKQRKIEEQEREMEMAKMLEEGRQRAIAIYKERERMLFEQRRKGGDVILAQIEEKKRNQQIEREREAQDRKAMLEANQKAREEDLRLMEEKRRRQREFLSECNAANRLALRRKQQEKEREIEENQMIAEFQREKALRDEEYEKKVAEAKKQKEYEIAEVRRLQQRAIDTKEQEDELRARRIFEELERKQRQKELEDIKKQKEFVEQFNKDRERQILLRKKRLVELAKIEKTEFDRIMAWQKAAKERERAEMEKRMRKNAEYREELKQEMERKREEKRLEPLKFLDEQKHQAEIQQDYIDRIERIRQMKIEKLRSEGVPEKYIADLRNRVFVIK